MCCLGCVERLSLTLDQDRVRPGQEQRMATHLLRQWKLADGSASVFVSMRVSGLGSFLV